MTNQAILSYQQQSIVSSNLQYSLLSQASSKMYNPSLHLFEKRIALLEKAKDAVVINDTSTAQYWVIRSIMQSGDNFITTNYFERNENIRYRNDFLRVGIEPRIIQSYHVDTLESLIDEHTKGIFIESVLFPNHEVPDFEAIASIARKHNIPLIVENTHAQLGEVISPAEHGADIVVASPDAREEQFGIGGIIFDLGKYAWANGKFNLVNEPYVSEWNNFKEHGVYGNIIYTAFLNSVIPDSARFTNPFKLFSYVQQQENNRFYSKYLQNNAANVADWLTAHQQVESVYYSGLSSDVGARAKYFKGGFGAAVTFKLHGGITQRSTFFSNFYYIRHSSSRHVQISTHLDSKHVKLHGQFITLWVGEETVEEIISDLDWALNNL